MRATKSHAGTRLRVSPRRLLLAVDLGHAPSAAPSAAAGVGAPADEGAGPAPSPSASPTASPSPPSKKPSTGEGGQSSEVNWKRVAFRTLGCKHNSSVPDRAEVDRVDHTDLTGDGRRDAIVVASCPTTTSTNAKHVFVFDGPPTKPLLDIGQDLSALRRRRAAGRSDRRQALSDDARAAGPTCDFQRGRDRLGLRDKGGDDREDKLIGQ